MIIPDHASQGIDPRCHEVNRDNDHRLNCRCGKCPVCGQWIKGIWWVEHEDEHWARNEKPPVVLPTLEDFLRAAKQDEPQLALF